MSREMHGRPDDLRFQHGAGKLQNLQSLPQGPAKKRPGTEFVQEVKNSNNKAKLLPFRFSQDQTLVMQMGRDTVDSREIGYVRLHTDGQTVLFTKQPDHLATVSITTVTASTTLTTSPAHGMATGDPIALTLVGIVGAAGIAASAPDPGTITLGGTAYEEGQQCIFTRNAGATLPAELEFDRLYYIREPSGTTFSLSETPGGNLIVFSTGSTGTPRFGAMPSNAATPIYARKRFYLIDIAATQFELAATKEDAIAGIAITFTEDGDIASNGGRLHYDYRIGDMVSFGAGSGLTYYCFRRPYGEDIFNLPNGDHQDHPPPDVNYWSKLPGSYATITTTFASDLVNWTAHGLPEGTPVIFSTSGVDLPLGIVAGTTYYVRNPNTNDFQISTSPNGTILDILDDGTGTHTGLANPIFEFPHFFELAEIAELRVAQSNDIVTVTHPNRPAHEFRRLGATAWETEEIDFSASDPPSDVSVVANLGNGFEVTALTATDPVILDTVTEHDMADQTQVYCQDISGTGSEVPDGFYVVEDTATNKATLREVEDHASVPSTGTTLGTNPMLWPVTVVADVNEVYVVTAIEASGQESAPSAEFSVFSLLHNAGAFNTVTWTAVPGATRYRVYKKQTGVFGFVGEVAEGQPLSFVDNNIAPDLSRTPPILDTDLRKDQIVTFDTTTGMVVWADHGLAAGTPIIFKSTGDLPTAFVDYKTYFVLNPTTDGFEVHTGDGISLAVTGADTDERHEAIAGLFPAAVGYYEQRRVFGGSLLQPQRMWMTVSATESDLSFSLPTVASDRIAFNVSAREASAIRHVAPLSHLVVLSASTEYRVTPVNDDALTPDSVSVRPQSFVGASTVQPEVVNNVVIFAADRGGHVREMGFSQDVVGYLTGDLSLRATHLFDDLTIDQIAYAKAPNPILWFVSSSGNLLGLTYIPEQEIGAWHHHVTDGTVESCAVVSEGVDDHLYLIVKRNIDGNDVRYVERMGHSHGVDAVEDSFFVDAGRTYDGAATTVITGLIHLANEAVAVLADGLVVSGLTVSATGTLTLPTAASKVHVGLAYTAELETLPITLNRPALGRGTQKNINSASVRVEASGGFLVGPDATDLTPSEGASAGVLFSGEDDVEVGADWNDDGQVLIRQTDPLPLTIVSVAYDVAEGD
jgi:hypothetical protein